MLSTRDDLFHLPLMHTKNCKTSRQQLLQQSPRKFAEQLWQVKTPSNLGEDLAWRSAVEMDVNLRKIRAKFATFANGKFSCNRIQAIIRLIYIKLYMVVGRGLHSTQGSMSGYPGNPTEHSCALQAA